MASTTTSSTTGGLIENNNPPGYDDEEGLDPGIEYVGQAVGGAVGGSNADSIARAIAANAATRSQANVPSGAPPALVHEAAQPEPISTDGMLIRDATFRDANSSGIGIGNVDPTTREVGEEELVANQLEGLLASDSPYIRNARMRAMEQANARGALGSSFAAGAAERAAIESGLPIATADAQAYRDTATQNMAALNQFALANLQRATALDTAVLSANTSRKMANLDAGVRTSIANLDAITKTNLANLDAATQTDIANLSSQTQLLVQKMVNENQRVLQGQQLKHDGLMEQLKQTGRIDLAQMDADLRMNIESFLQAGRLDLAAFEQDGRINLANLDFENRTALESMLNDYKVAAQEGADKFERQTQHANLAMQAQLNYTNYVTAFADTKMDKDAAARLRDDAWNKLVAEFQMINGLYPEFDAITPTRSSTGGVGGSTGGGGGGTGAGAGTGGTGSGDSQGSTQEP